MFLDAFKSIFLIIGSGNTELGTIILISLEVTLTATFIASLFGIICGFLLAVTDFKFKKILIAVLNTSLAMPTVVIGLFLYGLLSRNGIFGNMSLLYTKTAIIIGQTILIFPIIITFVHSAVKSVDPRIEKTARSLGAGIYHTSLVIMREAKFGILLAVVAAFGRGISEVGISMMLGGNIADYTRNMTTTIALEHNKGNFAFALAVGMILLFITFGINVFFHYIQKINKK